MGFFRPGKDAMSFALAEETGWWWAPFDGPGMTGGVSIVHVDLTPNAVQEAEAAAWLSADEQARRGRFLQAAAARRYTLCRAALRAVLCGRLGCENHELAIVSGEFGKPFALVRGAAAEIGFNVSHSGSHGLIALARGGRLGVDVEELAAPRNLELLIDSVLTPEEKAGISALSPTERTRGFLRLWSIKEALLKADGAGLSLDVSAMEVPAGMRRGASHGVFRFPDSPETAWRVADLGNQDFAAALAWTGLATEDTENGRGAPCGRPQGAPLQQSRW